MKIFSEVIGNMTTDPQWAEKLKNTKIEYWSWNQWTAQKVRSCLKVRTAQEYARRFEASQSDRKWGYTRI